MAKHFSLIFDTAAASTPVSGDITIVGDVPAVPTANGFYALTVASAGISWSAVAPTAPTAQGVYKLSVSSEGAATWAADVIPALPTENGDYKLHIADGVATWVAIV